MKTDSSRILIRGGGSGSGRGLAGAFREGSLEVLDFVWEEIR